MEFISEIYWSWSCRLLSNLFSKNLLLYSPLSYHQFYSEYVIHYVNRFNPFLPNVPFLCPLKTSENLRLTWLKHCTNHFQFIIKQWYWAISILIKDLKATWVYQLLYGRIWFYSAIKIHNTCAKGNITPDTWQWPIC